jgi:hypothetical protein
MAIEMPMALDASMEWPMGTKTDSGSPSERNAGYTEPDTGTCPGR